jgi:hypothetical protein
VAAVLLFVLFQQVPVVLLLVLVVCLYLVWIDIRQEDVDFQVKVWWFLFVFLLHVPGYLIFRGWIALRRHRAGEQA